MLIKREHYLSKIKKAFKTHRIVALLGPRQCGKTTLAREIWEKAGNKGKISGYFDLENPTHLESLREPDLTLKRLTGLIVVDEIQRRPNLFTYLRYLHDENLNQTFLILGSASQDLIQQSSESLAGRIAYIEITPFSLGEVKDQRKLWVQGGFPRSYLEPEEQSFYWRQQYVKTYIEQDLRNLGLEFDTSLLRRFWFMLAHYHGQIFNASELAQSLSISAPTVKKYLSYLENAFMVRVLNPWFSNLKKRQVKSPKIYFRDSGLLHYFLGIENENALIMNPKVGASWEGFALEEVCRLLEADGQDCYFWGTHNKAELDLLVLQNGQKKGFEFKYQDAPKLTPSMLIAMEDLQLDKIEVIYPGSLDYAIHEKVQVRGLSNTSIR